MVVRGDEFFAGVGAGFEAGFTIGFVVGCDAGLRAGCGGGCGACAGVGVGKMIEADPGTKFMSGVPGLLKRKEVFCGTEDLTVKALELGEV